MIRVLFISLIRLYQWCVSPFMGRNCRFYPSCSEYSLQSLQKHGVLKGCLLTLVRLCKCHPFHPGGYDPVR